MASIVLRLSLLICFSGAVVFALGQMNIGIVMLWAPLPPFFAAAWVRSRQKRRAKFHA